jgi:2-oxoacid:acceptor oxidoreductase gamma subunit (pyruvate/2-ketoisovalerate family)
MFLGRGGQGCVTSAEVLATAVFFDGKEAQAFPFFGVERSGAPVKSFCRIGLQKIRLHEHVSSPDCVVVLDDSLLDEKFFLGLKQGVLVIVATNKSARDLNASSSVAVRTVDAYEIANEVIGKPFVNIAVLGAFAKASGLVSLASLEKAVRKRFEDAQAEKNFAAAKKCFDAVK